MQISWWVAFIEHSLKPVVLITSIHSQQLTWVELIALNNSTNMAHIWPEIWINLWVYGSLCKNWQVLLRWTSTKSKYWLIRQLINHRFLRESVTLNNKPLPICSDWHILFPNSPQDGLLAVIHFLLDSFNSGIERGRLSVSRESNLLSGESANCLLDKLNFPQFKR